MSVLFSTIRRRFTAGLYPCVISYYSHALYLDSINNDEGDRKATKDIIECHIPACSEKGDLLKRSFASLTSNLNSQGKRNSVESEIGELKLRNSNGHDETVHSSRHIEEDISESEPNIDSIIDSCPLDRSELGRSSWNLIHSIAANYPDNPSLHQQGTIHFYSFCVLYSHIYSSL